MLFNFDTIAQLCSGTLCTPDAALTEANGLVWDSRQVSKGYLYAALVGERVDGHDFCEAAINDGAAGVLVSKMPSGHLLSIAAQHNAGIVCVDNVELAIQQLAGAWRQHLQGCVIALTGSSGKTTTKNFIRRVLASHDSCVATLANQNNELGVPATILRANTDTKYIVVEMGMRGLGQIESLCAFVKPDVSLITNVGVAHMELLGSRENIARAKAEIIAGTVANGVAFINSSDDFAHELPTFGQAETKAVRVIYFDGSGNPCDSYDESIRPHVYASDITLDALGYPSFVLHTPQGSAACTLQLLGAINVHNACAAAAIGSEMGIPVEKIAQALSEELPEPGRQHVRQAAGGWIVVDDSYNANPDSMTTSLDALAAVQARGQKIAVLGDMGELGSAEREGHEQVGRKAAEVGLDKLICVGEQARYMAQAAREAGMDASAIICVDAAKDATLALNGALSEGDYILVKASHSMGLSLVVEGLVNA